MTKERDTSPKKEGPGLSPTEQNCSQDACAAWDLGRFQGNGRCPLSHTLSFLSLAPSLGFSNTVHTPFQLCSALELLAELFSFTVRMQSTFSYTPFPPSHHVYLALIPSSYPRHFTGTFLWGRTSSVTLSPNPVTLADLTQS